MKLQRSAAFFASGVEQKEFESWDRGDKAVHILTRLVDQALFYLILDMFILFQRILRLYHFGFGGLVLAICSGVWLLGLHNTNRSVDLGLAFGWSMLG